MHLSRIIIYPVKSLDGIEVSEIRLTEGGMLENDRAYAIVDEKGGIVNGKRTARVHDLRSTYSPDLREIFLCEKGSARTAEFALNDPALNGWLSDFFGFAVHRRHEPISGFPDDREAFGPTIVGEASLREVASWFPGLDLESARRRFRTNFEISDEAGVFCEDRLYGAPGELRPFRIGAARFHGHNPCQRCVVPTRNPDGTGPIPGFQKEFMKRRQETLPAWADARRFNHYYRFAVNTSTPAGQAGLTIRAGDLVELDPA